jgi:UDP-N-acetylglucosamine 2-epimerase (non-hydrolysing)
MNVLCVLGTRPEAIKLGPVIRELRRIEQHESPGERIRVRVCVTGQHRELLDPMLSLFRIEPDYDLEAMQKDQSPTRLASAVLAGLEPILKTERPDWVLVQGDTTSVASAAIAAHYAGVRVAHVEAGLRTGDKWRPFPEEINRRIAGVIAELHLAPTESARRNLRREGVPADRIRVTGNPIIDALHWVGGLPPTSLVTGLLRQCGMNGPHNHPKQLVLVTAHRRESLGAPLTDICLALRDVIGQTDGNACIVYPVHLNPHVWEPVHNILGGVPGIVLTPPLDYVSLVHLLKRCYLVLTDSGGLQEEAPGFGVPVLVLRDVTERPESIEAGVARLVGTSRERIVRETLRLLRDGSAHEGMARAVSPYGDGRAAVRIASALRDSSARRSVCSPTDAPVGR